MAEVVADQIVCSRFDGEMYESFIIGVFEHWNPNSGKASTFSSVQNASNSRLRRSTLKLRVADSRVRISSYSVRTVLLRSKVHFRCQIASRIWNAAPRRERSPAYTTFVSKTA